MGCASSSLLGHDDDFTQIGSSSLGHHIVSLTSTTYGLLTLDPPSSADDHRHQTPISTTPPPRFTIGSLFPTTTPHSSDLKPLRCEPPEVINSWELMAGLDPITTDSFRFSPLLFPHKTDKENSNPNFPIPPKSPPINRFEKLCPPNGEDKVVIYTTTLRGVRRTYEACNAVRAAIQGAGVAVCERDISMDKGFREELRELMKGKESSQLVPPRVFVRGRYVGGYEEVMRMVEEGEESGGLVQLLQGLPKSKIGYVCEGCGGARFLPCFGCNGSCKMVMVVKEVEMGLKHGKTVVVRCPDCNENGLVLCPICS